jgi:hypothetical protein
MTQKTHRQSHRQAYRPVPFALVPIAALLLSASAASAFNPQPEPPGSVAFGIAESQVAEIALVHVSHPPDPVIPPDPIFPPDPVFPAGICAVAMTFSAADGTVVAESRGELEPGRILGFRVAGAELGLRVGSRLKLRATVEFLGDAEERLRCNATVKAGVEVYDARTGVASLLLPVPTTYLPPRRDAFLDR